MLAELRYRAAIFKRNKETQNEIQNLLHGSTIPRKRKFISILLYLQHHRMYIRSISLLQGKIPASSKATGQHVYLFVAIDRITIMAGSNISVEACN
jgi:hypothetical protein